ncbi:MAG: SDR family NAD(P)-dependent oxidoreductase [Candidatus Bathyarchaeia archaeon]
MVQPLLSDKVAIVTGGARGIGKSIALKFAEHGCSIAIADILIEEGNKTANEIEKMGRSAIFIPCDVTRSEQVYSMVNQTIRKFGKIDILVNNAGGISIARTSGIEQSEEDWDKLINLNLKSAFLFCRAVAPLMRARRYGKIINISSIGVISPPECNPGYAAAKAGMIGLTIDLATELAPFNVNVNAILPGPIRGTGFLEGRSLADIEAFWEEAAKKHVPFRRCGMPEDVANTALFLASDLSSFITGALIPVSGGIPLPVRSI